MIGGIDRHLPEARTALLVRYRFTSGKSSWSSSSFLHVQYLGSTSLAEEVGGPLHSPAGCPMPQVWLWTQGGDGCENVLD